MTSSCNWGHSQEKGIRNDAFTILCLFLLFQHIHSHKVFFYHLLRHQNRYQSWQVWYFKWESVAVSEFKLTPHPKLECSCIFFCGGNTLRVRWKIYKAESLLLSPNIAPPIPMQTHIFLPSCASCLILLCMYKVVRWNHSLILRLGHLHHVYVGLRQPLRLVIIIKVSWEQRTPNTPTWQPLSCPSTYGASCQEH